jgi:hypothetical protein
MVVINRYYGKDANRQPIVKGFYAHESMPDGIMFFGGQTTRTCGLRADTPGWLVFDFNNLNSPTTLNSQFVPDSKTREYSFLPYQAVRLRIATRKEALKQREAELARERLNVGALEGLHLSTL